jgi:hypothetical protein
MIYVECKPDFAMVKTLGVPKRNIIHAGNKSKVCRRLKRSDNSKGLVDEDPLNEQPSYVEKLNLIRNQDEIKTLQDSQRGNFLIVLCPRLEEWVLKATKEAEIDITRYNLPDDGDRLHKVINTNIEKFEKLIKDLKGKSRMMKALEKSIKERRLK